MKYVKFIMCNGCNKEIYKVFKDDISKEEIEEYGIELQSHFNNSCYQDYLYVTREEYEHKCKIIDNKAQILIKFEDNWANEMDICGCAVMTVSEWRKYVAIAKDYFDSMDKIDFNKVIDDDDGDWLSDVSTLSFVIGSNEWIEYESFDELMNCFTISALTDEQAEFLKANGFKTYGFFPDEIFDEWIGYKEYH